MKNITISIPEKIDFKNGYRKIMGRTSMKGMIKALRSRHAKVRYAAVETLLELEGNTRMLNTFPALTEMNKDIIAANFACQLELTVRNNKENN